MSLWAPRGSYWVTVVTNVGMETAILLRAYLREEEEINSRDRFVTLWA